MKIYYSAQARLIFGVLALIALAAFVAMMSILLKVPTSWHVPQIAATIIIATAPFLVRWTSKII